MAGSARTGAAFGSALFFVIAPGTVAALSPLLGTRVCFSRSVKNCGVHPAGAHPPELSA